MKVIEIPTAQNVVILYEQAAARARQLGALADMLFVVVGFFLLCIIAALAQVDVFGSAVFVFGLIVSYILYHLLFDVWGGGQTLGKWLMGTRTIRIDGRPIDWSDAFARSLLLLIDGVFSFGVVGTLLIQAHPRSQRLGDMVAHTTVVNLQPQRVITLADVLGILTAQSHTVTYPQVRQLTEKDMLFTRSVLQRLRLYPNEAHWDVADQLAKHLADLLEVPPPKTEEVYDFLETLLRDYVALTR